MIRMPLVDQTPVLLRGTSLDVHDCSRKWLSDGLDHTVPLLQEFAPTFVILWADSATLLAVRSAT